MDRPGLARTRYIQIYKVASTSMVPNRSETRDGHEKTAQTDGPVDLLLLAYKRVEVHYASLLSNLFFRLSINIAPNGAVINIATTAAVSTNVPQARPSDKAIAPIDA